MSSAGRRRRRTGCEPPKQSWRSRSARRSRSEEHTSELQSRLHLVCRLLLEKKKKQSLLLRSVALTLPAHSAPPPLAATHHQATPSHPHTLSPLSRAASQLWTARASANLPS